MLKAFFKSTVMGFVQKQLQHLYYINENIDDIAKGIVKDNADKILDVLKNKQLGIGQYYNGRPLRFTHKGNSGDGYYARRTQDAANAENAITDKPYGQPYNFQWSGGTFAKMGIKLDVQESYSIFTRDGKEALLKKIYGNKLFKLSKENNKWVNENILEPELILYIEENWWRSIK